MAVKLYSTIFVFIHLISIPGGLSQSFGRARGRCPSECLCFGTTVRCMFLHLEQIPKVSTDTTILDLRFNKIRSITADSFTNLRNLNTLLLNNNHISKLQDGAFRGLENLRYLYLYKNRIRHIQNNVFKNMTKLEQLYLHFNKLVKLSPNLFTHLEKLQRLFLHNNRIQNIPRGSFKNLRSLKRLRLDSNALVCDCQLMWLAKMVEEKSKTQVAATCEYPSELHGKSLTRLMDSEFQCKNLPQITEEPSDVTVNFGGTAYFTCNVEGYPEPEVVWFHNNEVIQDNPRASVLNDGTTLMIEEAQGRDMGFYECMAQNPMGQVHSRKAKIVMNDAPSAPLVEGPVLESRPRLYVSPSDTNATTGTRVHLQCQATGYPTPDITWFTDDTQITLDSRVKITDEGHLIISEAFSEDAGLYRCQAANHLGRDSETVKLQILALPRFTLEPTDVYTSEGGTVVFSCETEGVPNPVISWSKDDVQIQPSRRFNIFIGGNRLRIQDVKRFDEGDYVCKAKSAAGVVSTEASLYVRDKLAPVIKIEPRDVIAAPGDEIEWPCYAQGLPLPSVTWKKDGQKLINTRKHRIDSNGSLFIYNVSLADEGIYECSATNYIGYATARATLTVQVESTAYIGDQFLEQSYEEANNRVTKAYNDTISKLFKRTRTKRPNPHELLRIFRFPRYEGRSIARISETIEQTLNIVQRHVEAGMKFNLTKFQYEDLLSPRKLRTLSELSGCLVHRRPVTLCDDLCFHFKYRTLDGSCNNFKNPMWGTSLIGFRRELSPIYENGFNTPVGWSKTKKYHGYFKPSARTVSTRLLSTEFTTPDNHCTHMLMQWGQFLDHDIDHALPAISTESFSTGEPCQRSCTYSAPCFPIKIPTDDPRVRHRCMEFTRSSAVCGSGTTSVVFDKVYPREQINQLTSYIDGSHIYSSSELELRGLRNLSYPYGELREGISGAYGKPLLPFSNGSPIDCRRNFSESAIDCFLAGDVRANEQVGLLSMHTLWFREHNRIAKELRAINPHWDGDTLFYESRKIIGAMMQHITYREWLPHIIGPEGMEKLGSYSDYKPQVDPTISNVFATAAFRFGHTLINPELQRLNSTFQPIAQGHLPLHKAFFSPWRIVEEGGIDPILRGLFVTPAKSKKPGQILNSELTEKLFQSAHDIALDLAAINIQRGRDHALPGYIQWRQFCNLSVPESFDDLTNDISSSEVRMKLRQLYGHPGNMDLFVGALLEDALDGGRVGPTVSCLLIKQFRDIRDGDRFWYENPSVFKPEQLTQIKETSLGRVICDNGDNITDVTGDVFVLPQEQTPSFVSCQKVPTVDLRMWSDCCNDCRNSGLFNNLITTSGRRFRRDTRFSFKEDRIDYLNGIRSSLVSNEDQKNASSYNDNVIPNYFPDIDKLEEISNSISSLDSFPPIKKSNDNSLYSSVENKYLQQSNTEKINEFDESFPSSGEFEDDSRPLEDDSRPLEDDSRPLEDDSRPLEDDPFDGYAKDDTEERIQGIESLVEQLLKHMEKLNRKIRNLENYHEHKRNVAKKRTCIDEDGIIRHKGETWNKEECVRCICKAKGVRCRVLKCPAVTCQTPVYEDDKCCPRCPS